MGETIVFLGFSEARAVNVVTKPFEQLPEMSHCTSPADLRVPPLRSARAQSAYIASSVSVAMVAYNLSVVISISSLRLRRPSALITIGPQHRAEVRWGGAQAAGHSAPWFILSAPDGAG